MCFHCMPIMYYNIALILIEYNFNIFCHGNVAISVSISNPDVFNVQVQQEVLQKRQKEKREHMDQIKKFRKGEYLRIKLRWSEKATPVY